MNKKKKELLESLDEKNKRVNAILDEAGEADLSTEQVKELDTLEKSLGDIEGDLAELSKVDGVREKAKKRGEYLSDPVNRPSFDNTAPTGKQVTDEVSRGLGAKFAQSDEYKIWLKSVAPQGVIQKGQQLHSPTIPFDGLEKALNKKAVVTAGSDTSGGALIQDVRMSLVNEGLMRPLTIRDLITIVPMSEGDTIEYPRMNSFTNNAATVAEANITTFTGAAGQVEGRKPESGIGLELITDRVRTIAHWIPATTRALMDVNQLAALIETFLLYGLREKSEDLVINGNGIGENFLGILNTPGIQMQDYDTNLLTTLRKARTKARTPGRVKPTAYALNPLDWEKIDLLKDNESRYYFGGPSELGAPRLWGLPVVESEAVPEGTGICAAWMFGVLYDRMQGSISASNSHADFFVRNLVALLAECREGFGIHYTKAFIECDLTPL